MAQIEWRQEFSIGIASVDQEHEKLIAEINQLYDQLRLPLDTETIEAMLDDLEADIAAHFALEELLMQEAGFSEYEDHKQDHERLLDQIHDMKFHFREDPETGRKLLTNGLSDWFSYHFRGFDARLHALLG
jgi:hemerythrin